MHSPFKWLLIGITAVAVISDSMLLPFYPQFFAAVYGITDPQYVGLYLALYGLVVMLGLPIWAALSKRVPTLQLLVFTQFAAGVFSILCYWAATPALFWGLSLTMILFKASYLLVYPFIMSLEARDKQSSTIGLLSVAVNFGAIAGALFGGVILQWFEPRQAFLVMALGDFAQMLVCAYLLTRPAPQVKPVKPTGSATPMHLTVVYKLSWVMLLFYLSASLPYHFFVHYWQSFSLYPGEAIAGLVFTIPAVMALLGLAFNHRYTPNLSAFTGIVPVLLLAIGGLLLQSSQQEVWVLLGRCLYGWGFFQTVVRLELLIFHLSTPATYASDYSKIRVAQMLGLLLAAYLAGWLVAQFGADTLFIFAAGGFLATLGSYLLLFKAERQACIPRTMP